MFDEQAINKFFLEGVPGALEKLAVDILPLWGSMHSKQVQLDLKQSTDMIRFQEKMKMRILQEKSEKTIAFLYSEKPIISGELL